jgi:hypothetical protein
MGMERYGEGVLSWVDVGSPGQAAWKASCAGPVGRDGSGASPEAGGDTEWHLSGRTIGGVMPTAPGVPAAVARLQELGGVTLLGPSDIDPGRFTAVADPQGAACGLIGLIGLKD